MFWCRGYYVDTLEKLQVTLQSILVTYQRKTN